MGLLTRLSALKMASGFARRTREEIRDFQNRQLRRLVAHAYENVPYYRRLFDREGLKPQDIRSLSDLKSCPITSKEDIINLPVKDLLARGADPKHLVLRHTSGSSGAVFTMWRSRFEEALSEAFRLRMRRYYGLRPSDKQANLAVDPLIPSLGRTAHKAGRALGLYRMYQLNSLLPPEAVLEELRRIRPDVIGGYAEVLARLSKHMDDDWRKAIRPRHIITTGEVLTPRMRADISEAFAAPVYDRYGTHELSLVAWECRQTGELHTCDDNVIVEVLKNGKDVESGERGEMVATNLHFFTMPFIRYRLGDIITKGYEQCECGEPYSTIRAIQGRMIDYFYLPDGRVIHPYQLGAPVKNSVSWIKQFQLIQEREDLIVANVAATEAPSQEEISHLKKAVATVTGEQVELQINFVSDIDWGTSGKFRLFRSNVRSDYDVIDWDNLDDGRMHSSAEKKRSADYAD